MNTFTTSMPMGLASEPTQTRPSWIARAAITVWSALEASGRARAEQHLLHFADQCESLQPELAKELRFASHHIPQD